MTTEKQHALGGTFGGRNPFGLHYPVLAPEGVSEVFGGDNIGDLFEGNAPALTVGSEAPAAPAETPASAAAAVQAGEDPVPQDAPAEPEATETPEEASPETDPTEAPAEPPVEAAPEAPAKPDPMELFAQAQQQTVQIFQQLAQSQQAMHQQMLHQQQVQTEWLQQQQARRAAEEQARQIEASRPKDPDWTSPDDVKRFVSEMGRWELQQVVPRLESQFTQKVTALEAQFKAQAEAVQKQAVEQQRQQFDAQLQSTVNTLKNDPRFTFMKTPAGEQGFLKQWWAENQANGGKIVDPMQVALGFAQLLKGASTGTQKVQDRDAQKRLDEQKRLAQAGKPVPPTLRSNTGQKPAAAKTQEQVLENLERERNTPWWETTAFRAD